MPLFTFLFLVLPTKPRFSEAREEALTFGNVDFLRQKRHKSPQKMTKHGQMLRKRLRQW